MTTTDWRPALAATPAVPQRCVRIEIKPHNSDGIAQGVKQLRSRGWSKIPNKACASGRPQHFLITYELQRAPSTVATIRIAAVQATGKKLPLQFRVLGTLSVPHLNVMMRRRSCHTIRGAIMENAIRKKYVADMELRFGTKIAVAPKSSTRSKGPDIDHEFAEFLTELAAELTLS